MRSKQNTENVGAVARDPSAYEEAYRALSEGLPDIVMRVDRALRYQFVSKNIEAATGIPAEDFLGKTAKEAGLPAGLRRFWEEAFTTVFLTGEPMETEYMLEGPHGPAIHHWRLIPERDESGETKHVLTVSRDITAHRRAQESYRTLFREMIDGYALHEIICDSTDRPVDYRFLAVNPAFERMTGLNAKDVVGRTVLELLPDTEPFWIKTYGRVALTGQPTSFEQTSAALGKHFEVRAFRPAPHQFVAIFTDITARKLAEEELQKSEARFRIAFHTSPDSVNINRLSDGLYIEVNDGFLRNMGYEREEVLGKTSLELGIWDDPADRERLVAGLRDHGVVENMEARFRRKDGSVCDGLMSARVITLGNESGILSITRDITERKHAEEERQKLEAQLQQSMKMEAVGRLAGGVAHDFNNLLTGIIGYTDMIAAALDTNDPMAEDLREIRKAADSAASLTRQLLAFSRRQLIEPVVLDLNELIGALHRMLARLIGEDIELVIIPRANPGAVKVDRGQFEQILINLAVNARDAMPHGGRIVIETANVELDEEYISRHPWASIGPNVLLAVSDTGHGMTDEVKERVFEPFFTTKPRGTGTGLGLSTIYGAVKQSGGSIEVYSEVGQGTAVKVYLPRALEAAVPLTAEPSTEISGGRGELVLLVEDEDMVRDLAVRLLKRLGYRVIAAPNGAEAIDWAHGETERIDLLLTDVVMPGMNGRQLAELVCERHPETKVLYTSGYTENAIAHHGVIDQDLFFISKPYTVTQLARKIRDVLGGE